MVVKVDLLPESYRQRRRRHGRFRLGVAVGAALLTGELAVGLALHARTAETRELLAETRDTCHAAEALRQKLQGMAQEASLLDQQVTLASRLRTTHRWSRLLAVLGSATPEKVVLTAVATNPPRWMPARSKAPPEGSGREPGPSAEVKPWIEGIVINGHAAEHGDLSRFVVALQASGAFAAVDLKNARRDRFLTQDAIAFELRCHW